MMQSNATILIADDDRAIRAVLSRALGRVGHRVRATGNASTLWQWVQAGDGDLVITDVHMPDGDGLELVPRIRALRPDMAVIVMSAQNTLLTAVKATDRGAFEYLPKPFDLTELLNAVERGLAQPSQRATAAREQKERDQNREETRIDRLPLIGRSAAMQDIYRVIARLVKTDLTALITGESGTGKELIARALHDFSRRREAPFVAVNMAAIPKELIESELFGHEKGAFTGANSRFDGKFSQAQYGTLFLDEIGDMPLEAQTRLLRVLQEGEYTRIGGSQKMRADVRIVAATHRDLTAAVQAGIFREDLFYRINVVPLRVPLLRERLDDIPDLVRHFVDMNASQGLPGKSFSAEALDALKKHSWPGNVRELENNVRRICALYSQNEIDSDVVEKELAGSLTGQNETAHASLRSAVDQHLRAFFSAHTHGLPSAGLYNRVLREIEKPLIEQTLDATRGNQIRAAEVLGLNRNTLRKKIRDLDIEVVRGLRRPDEPV